MKTLLAAGAFFVAVVGAATPTDAWAGPLAWRAEQADMGFLDVASDPPAKILIDGADIGKVTPQSHLELKVGHHKLTLTTLDGARSRSIGFTVTAGQTTKLTVHLTS